MSDLDDPSPADGAPPALDRDDIRAILAKNIRALDRAIAEEPPTDPGAEQRWLARMQTLRGLASEYRKLEKDRDLDEMADEIEMLKDDVPETR